MLSRKRIRPSFFDKQHEPSQTEKERDFSEETTEERLERIKFRSLRSHRKKGDRSMGWLLFLLILVGAIFWYLS